MDLILVEDVPKLGVIGDQVTVRPGYGRNYLVPHGHAIVASTKNKARLDHEKRLANYRKARSEQAAQAIASKLRKTEVTISRKAGEQDKLFGSVTSHDIADALAEAGAEVDRRKLILDEPIKAVGTYQVPIRLAGDLTVDVKVTVVAE